MRPCLLLAKSLHTDCKVCSDSLTNSEQCAAKTLLAWQTANNVRNIVRSVRELETCLDISATLFNHYWWIEHRANKLGVVDTILFFFVSSLYTVLGSLNLAWKKTRFLKLISTVFPNTLIPIFVPLFSTKRFYL